MRWILSIGLAVLMLGGCSHRSYWRGPDLPAKRQTTGAAPTTPKKKIDIDRERAAKLKAEWKAAEAAVGDDELQPLRSALTWFELVGIALMVLGGAAAAASFIWPALAIAKRVWLSAIIGGAAILSMSLATAFVLNYLGWVIGLTVAIVIGVIAIYAHDAHGRWRAKLFEAEDKAKKIIN